MTTGYNGQRYLERSDLNYEDLENSIVDSLSEISIASSIPLSIQTQETINDVVSSYLWSTDVVSLKIDSDVKKTKKRDPPEPKNAWESFDNFDSYQKKDESKGFTSSSLNKLSVPSLDLSYLNNNNEARKITNNSTKPDLESKDKNAKVRSSHEGSYTIKHDTKPSESKLRTSISGSKIGEGSLIVIKQDIEYLLRELKLSKANTSDYNDFYDQESEIKVGKQENGEKIGEMASNLKQLLERLLEKRRNSKRNMIVEKMSREEIQQEKVDTQKELLSFEEKHGRPQTKLEKDLMRPLYDHYRKVKRILAKFGNPNNSTSKAFSDSHNEDNDDEDNNNYKDHKAFYNLHSMNMHELNREKEQSLLEKSRLKDQIKKIEADFFKATGRQLTKEDREYHREDFEKYKVIKAKLKLLEALMEKNDSKK